MDVASLLAGALANPHDEAQEDRTLTRILDAAVTEAAAQGVAHVTVDGIAQRSGVSRATVYRKCRGREGLLAAMTLREGQRMSEQVAAAMAAAGPGDEFVEGFVAAVRLARGHPIVSRMIHLEVHRLVAAATAEDGALFKLGCAFVASGLGRARKAGRVSHVDIEEAAETVIRIFAGLILVPVHHRIDLDSDDSIRAYARRTLAPMLFDPER
jgi:AcrR family transcriptional regulator